MIGFLILGPASAGLMIYDLIFGLEHHEYHEIPPWVRILQIFGNDFKFVFPGQIHVLTIIPEKL